MGAAVGDTETSVSKATAATMISSKSETTTPVAVPDFPLFSLRSHRFRVMLVLLLTYFITISARVIFSMNIVCMVNGTAARGAAAMNARETTGERDPVPDGMCIRDNTSNASEAHSYEGSIDWSPGQSSFLIAATFYGSCGTALAVGPVVQGFGARKTILVCLLVYIVVNAVTPFLAELSYAASLVTRVCLGAADAFIFPSLSAIAARWFAPSEKSTAISIFSSGLQLGNGLSPLISAQFCGSSVGWSATFYLFAVLTVVSEVIWWWTTTDTPDTSRCASDQEKAFLASRLRSSAPLPKVTLSFYGRLLRSPRIIALNACFLSYGATIALLQSYLPTMLDQRFALSIQMNGLYMLVPFVFQLVAKLILGPVFDLSVARIGCSQTTSCRVAQTIAGVGTAIALVGLVAVPTCRTAWTALPFLILYGVSMAAMSSGAYTSLLCIVPRRTASIASLGAFCMMSGYVLSTTSFSLLTTTDVGPKWEIVFGGAAFLNVLSSVLFIKYGTGSEKDFSVKPSTAPQP